MTDSTAPGTDPGTAAASRRDRRRGFSNWWYLVYLGTLGFQPLLVPGASGLDWLAAGVLAAVGALVYGIGLLRPERLVGSTVGLAALGVLGVWVNGGASVFFVYAAANAGSFEPRTRARAWLIGLTALLGVLILVVPIPMPYRIAAFAFPLVFIWIVGNEVMQDAERGREAARLRVDNARVEHLATLGERERIARDLHDLLGHTLTGVVVRAQVVQRVVAADPARAAREAADIEHMARGALTEVRATVSGWRHHTLDAEIEAGRDALHAAGVTLHVQHATAVAMSPPVEAGLALAVREAVTNVIRHSGATACHIDIAAADGQVRLAVTDDGRGARRPEGSGLTGMRERIAALGGTVDRRTGDGTTILVTVPAQQVVA